MGIHKREITKLVSTHPLIHRIMDLESEGVEWEDALEVGVLEAIKIMDQGEIAAKKDVERDLQNLTDIFFGQEEDKKLPQFPGGEPEPCRKD